MKQIITASQINDNFNEGSNKLYTDRFGFGRENDFNEFSYSIESHNLHPVNPFKLSLNDLMILSDSNKEVFQNALKSRIEDKKTDYRFTEDIIEDTTLLKSELQLTYKYHIDDISKHDQRDNISIIDLLTHHELFESTEWNLNTKFNDERYITLNKCTVLDNAFTSNRNLVYLNRTRRFGEIVKLIKSDELKNKTKEQRPQFYYTANGSRPDNTVYHKWNGFQIFDLDLKYAKCFAFINIAETKQLLFDMLKQYKWFLGIGVSSSGKGIHIYTKVCRPHQYFVNESDNEDLIKYWYRVSYTQKYAAIRYILENVCKIDNGDDPKHPVIDFAMAKISQGVRIAYDPEFIVNPEFEDLQPIFDFNHPPVENLESSEWILRDYIVDNPTFKMWEKMNFESAQKEEGTYVAEIDITYGDTIVTMAENKQPTPYNGEVYYQLRYNVCNTIATFFGEEGRAYAHIVLKSKQCKNVTEINGIYTCSLNASKKPTKFGLQVLRDCGFTVVLGDKSKEMLFEDTKRELHTLIEKAAAKNSSNTDCTLLLKSDEYLGNHVDFVLDKIKHGCANLLMSPPGSGKTELVKTLSNSYRVLLVLPYISVIDAKVSKDTEISENFDAYFGSTKVNEIKSGKSAVMTLDKFGRLDIERIAYMYDYIMIDESHLIFTSSFRLEAMSNSLKNIKTLIDMSKLDEYSSKLVLMTGTPTGEIPYFSFYNILNKIDVRKEESRTKIAEFILCTDSRDMIAKIAMQVADNLKHNKKVLYPTNAGDVQASRLIGMVEHLLGRTIKWSYYKKANSNSEMSVSINEYATVGDYELVLASNYLSVGIDIKDISDFECIYDSSFAGYEIEQFNCRLRNVNINSKIYIPLYDNDGNVLKNLLNYDNFSIRMNREDRDLLRDYVDISKKKLELSMTYDPITNRIFTPGFRIENGQIVFKLEEHELTMFEERFLETMRSPYFISYSLADYGYSIKITDSTIIDKKIINDLITVGLENAKIESQYRNDCAINTFTWLLDNDMYTNQHGMEVSNLVNRIWKESIEIEEDPNLKSIIVDESILGEVIKIHVTDRRIFDEQLATASRFLSLYAVDTCKFIFSLCIKSQSGKINKSDISRYMKLIQFIKMEERGNLGSEIYETIKFMYEYIDPFIKDPGYSITQEEHNMRIDYCTQLYLKELGLELRSQKMMKKYKDEVTELINVFSTKSISNGELRLSFRMLPTPDSPTRIKLNEYNSILKQMFNISDMKLPGSLQDIIHLRHLPQTDINSVEMINNVRHGAVDLLDINVF